MGVTLVAVEQPQIGAPNIATHTGFILAEDASLKAYLSGIKVPERPGSANQTDVGVWFRFPEGERQIKYPFITIDLLNAEPAYDLFTSVYREDEQGLYQPSVSPNLPVLGSPLMKYSVPNYLPFRLVYQVTVHSRSAMHDRYLMSLFMTDVIPPRPFWLKVDADGTYRRIERVGFTQSDQAETTESGSKRIFRKIYTITLMAEIPQAAFFTTYRVLRALLSVVDRDSMDTYFTNILKNQPDPLNDFTEEERVARGEYFTSWAEGRELPATGAPPPG